MCFATVLIRQQVPALFSHGHQTSNRLQFGANNRRAVTTAIFDVRKFSHKSLFRILWLLFLCSNFSVITLYVYHRTLKICLLYYYNTQNLCWFAYTRMSGINQSKLANRHVLGHWRFSSISDMMSSHFLATTCKWTPYESIVAFEFHNTNILICIHCNVHVYIIASFCCLATT